MCTEHCQYMACALAHHQATLQPMSTFSSGLHYSENTTEEGYVNEYGIINTFIKKSDSK